jgi:hypothetical protein
VWRSDVASVTTVLPPSRGQAPCRRQLYFGRLAVAQDMDACGRCRASKVLSEYRSWPINQVGALREADGPPGSPMHGNSMIWVNEVYRLCRLLSVEMARTDGWSPASDWHQGDVDLSHLLEGEAWTGIARIPAAAGAVDKISERGSAMRAGRMPPTVVVGG